METREVVLVVDDTIDNLEILSSLVTEAGFICAPLTSGEDAVEVALKVKPALVVVDLMMPKVDGMEVTRRFKEHPELSHIPIMMVTSDESAEEAALDAGCLDYVQKPVNAERFINKVQSYCSFSVLDQKLIKLLKSLT